MRVRKHHSNLTSSEWTKLIAAIDAMHGTAATPPAYRRFVSLHVDAMNGSHMDWSVHTMQMSGGPLMRGKNFLAWHRRFIKLFEDRRQLVDTTVTLPYWDATSERAIPAALNEPELLARWSVTREWDPPKLASKADLAAVKQFSGSFTGFQTLIEGAIHSDTHNAVGGDMAGSASPTDPLFWLHHAFLDKTWAEWQASLNGKNPPSPDHALKPATIAPGVKFGVKVSSLLSINALDYSYA